jgi:predicted TPR repeat methyltransferase
MNLKKVNPMRYREKIYDTYASVSGLQAPLQSKYQALAHNLTRHLRTVPSNEKVLDIGSGQGELLELCRNLGIRAEGVDISRELTEACNERELKVTLIDDLKSFIEGGRNAWWLVTMIDVMEHFTKDEAFEILSLVYKCVLRPGGKIILQVPNMQSPFAALNLYCDLTHEWGYTEASLAQLLRSVGFRKVGLYPQNYPPFRLYVIRHALRSMLYLFWRSILIIDQPNRGSILTPNLIAVAEV